MGLLDRFGQDQGGHNEWISHPEQLTWPGDADGFPILGRVPTNLRQDEYESLDHKALFYSYGFKMWEPEDHAAYSWVKTRISNGWFTELAYERRWDPEHPHQPLIWLEWSQRYAVPPAGMQDAIQIQIERQQPRVMQVSGPHPWAQGQQ